MRPVRPVDEHEHPPRVQKVRDLGQLVCNAVVRRVDEKRGACPRMRRRCAPHLGKGNAHRDAEPRVDLRLHVDRARTDEDQPADDRAVHVARHEHRIPGHKRRHEHRMDRARRAVDHEICGIRPIRPCRHLLRRADASRRCMEVVELRRERDIGAQPRLRQKIVEQRMRPAPALMSRCMEWRDTKICII